MTTINHLSAGMFIRHEPTGYTGYALRFYDTMNGELRAVCMNRLNDPWAEQESFNVEEVTGLTSGVESAFGEAICDFSEITPGDLLYDGSITYRGEPNVMRVLRFREGGDGFYAVFVNPANPTELRQNDDREFHTWDYEVPGAGLHRADELFGVPDCLPPDM